MLKILGGVILSVAIIASAYAPPAYAASASVVLTQVQAGGDGAAPQELVVLYNNSDTEVDITGWCLKNKSAVKFACFVGAAEHEHVFLPGRSFATAASSSLATFLGFSNFSIIYTSTNQSSGAIVGSNDHITLVNAADELVDQHSWATTILGGMLYERSRLDGEMLEYQDTNMSADWSINSPTFLPDDETVRRIIEPDPPTWLPLLVTELMPNVAGADDGNEFIEIYNPNDVAVDLAQYSLLVGPLLERRFTFAPATMVEPMAYFTITNQMVRYTLLNSTSRVGIAQSNGVLIFETPPYDSPKENMAWALIGDIWQYTNQPTSGMPNVAGVEVAEEPAPTTSLKPCASHQYRHPETRRCRNRVVASTPKPCRADQVRNPATNRCRKVQVAASLTPCGEGRERNPETNRCRKVAAMPKADYAVLAAQTSAESDGWYVWAVIAALALAALAYAVWEWRFEISKLIQRIKKFVRSPR